MGGDGFPAVMPLEKPDRPLSAAMERLYDKWNPHADRGNELFSNFKYSRLEGFERGPNISRRDPSKVLKIDGLYYVWYTKRHTITPPQGPEKATHEIPSYDWDMAEIWYASSKDGFTWEEQGVAITRPPKPEYGWRSVSTPDILAWKGKYYLFYQGFNEIPGLRADRAAATVAEADSQRGPWRPLGHVAIDFGADDEWDRNAIHDPYPLLYKGKIYLYYKGETGYHGKGGTMVRAQGVAIADHPFGPYTKHPMNPVINSGHETGLFPFKGGIAAIVSLDGPEKNTVQWAPDGVNFQMMSILQITPIAPGPFVPDAFADNGDGRGITWGLCHMSPLGPGPKNRNVLARFDCDLSLDVDEPLYKHNNMRFRESFYLQDRQALSDSQKEKILANQKNVDNETIR